MTAEARSRSIKTQAVINAEMQMALENLEQDVQEILKILKGNGKTGLVDQVMAHGRDLEIIKRQHECEAEDKRDIEKARRDFWSKLTFWAVTMILTNIGVIVTFVVKISQMGN